MTFGETIHAKITALRDRGHIVSMRIDGGLAFSPVTCTDSCLTWIAFGDHPAETDILHVVNLAHVREVAIEDVGQHLYAPETPTLASEPQDSLRAAELRGKRAAMDAIHAALLALSQEIEAGE